MIKYRYLIPIILILGLGLLSGCSTLKAQELEEPVLYTTEEVEEVRDMTIKIVVVTIIKHCAKDNKVAFDVNKDGKTDVIMQCFLKEPI